MSVVSEREFLSLPNYLRQISLSSLNQTIHQINSAAEKQLCGQCLKAMNPTQITSCFPPADP